MTDTHVVSALKEKRMHVAGQIESLQGQLRQATIDLDHVEAALRLFNPEVGLAALSPRKVGPVLYDTKGDTGRVILETLRTAMRPLSTAQVCDAVMKARSGCQRQWPVRGDDAADQCEPETLAAQAGPDPVYAGTGATAFVGSRALVMGIFQRLGEMLPVGR